MRLEVAVARFTADLELGRSPRTAQAYAAGVARYCEWLGAMGQLPESVDGLSVDAPVEFARWIGRAAAPATTRTYLVGVVAFYRFLVRERIRPSLGVGLEELRGRLAAVLGRPARSLPRVPSDDVVDRLVEAARSSRVRSLGERGRLIVLRDVAIVETLRGSGLRVSELVALRVGDLVDRAGEVRVVGKGAKERRAYLTAAAGAAIGEYLVARGGLTAGDPLFGRHDVGAGGGGLRAAGVRRVLERLVVAAGLGVKVTPHRLRAWFATRVLAAAGDLAAAQDLLGHADPSTTRIYASVAESRLRDVHRRSFDEG